MKMWDWINPAKTLSKPGVLMERFEVADINCINKIQGFLWNGLK